MSKSIVHGGGTANLGGEETIVNGTETIVRRGTEETGVGRLRRALGPIACGAVLLVGAAACSDLGDNLKGIADGMSGAGSTMDKIVATLRLTPRGSALVDWLKASEASAVAAVGRFNAELPGGGLSVEQIRGACAADNVAHTFIEVALTFAPVPAGVAAADELGYKAIQGTCALATAGKLPDADGVKSVVSMWTATAGALQAK